MKERQFYVHPGLRDDPTCQLDGQIMADNVIRGGDKCGLCGVALELWEQRKVNQQEDRK